MNYELFIALRFLFGRRKEKFISIISIISILGVVIGVASLIIVLAVMNGFDFTLKEKIVGTNYHIMVEGEGGLKADAEPLIKEISNEPHVIATTTFMNGQAIIKFKDSLTGVVVRGIEPLSEEKVTKVKDYLKGAALDVLKEKKIIIGNQLAERLNVNVNDKLTIISPITGKNFEFSIAGIFNSGMYEYDAGLVFINIKNAQEIYNSTGLAGGIGIKVDNVDKAKETAASLQKKLGMGYWVRSWSELNKNLFSALKLEKTVMFIILTLIILVACFNIIGTLILVVMEKIKDIGILKSIGATSKSIMRIFVLDGFIIGLIGTMCGLGLGYVLSYLLERYQFVKLPADIYYIDKIPVRIEIFDIALIMICSIVITLLATIYPSIQAARLKAVDALRYE